MPKVTQRKRSRAGIRGSTTPPSGLSQTGRLQSWIVWETAMGLCSLRPHPGLELPPCGVCFSPEKEMLQVSAAISKAQGASIRQSIGTSRCRLDSLMENIQICEKPVTQFTNDNV